METAASCQTTSVTPDRIMQIGLGFWASKTLLSGVELDIFTKLAQEPMDAKALEQALGLHPRATRDFLDALVALGFLAREGELYSNTPESDLFLDRNKSSYIGGILNMCSTRLFRAWSDLTTCLQTGKPFSHAASGSETFDQLYATPDRMREFLTAMTGISLPAARALAEKFSWAQYKTFADIGCAQGAVPVMVAQAHPHLSGIGYDLAPVRPVFEEYVSDNGLADRVKFRPGNFFEEKLPTVDVIVMGHILHDWNLEDKKMLLRKAYEALPSGGALIVYEALIDDDRSANAFGLLMSLNMLVETPGGFDYTGADCQEWMKEAGFAKTWVEHLCGPDSMVVAVK